MLQESGLSDWLGCQLGVLDSIPKPVLVFICGAVMTMFTEFTSNTSSASIFLPILAQLVSMAQFSSCQNIATDNWYDSQHLNCDVHITDSVWFQRGILIHSSPSTLLKPSSYLLEFFVQVQHCRNVTYTVQTGTH